jgi:hypothetical protein
VWKGGRETVELVDGKDEDEMREKRASQGIARFSIHCGQYERCGFGMV